MAEISNMKQNIIKDKRRDNTMKKTERFNFIEKFENGTTLKNIDTRVASELNELLTNPDKHNLDTLEKEFIKTLFRTDRIWDNDSINIVSFLLNSLRDDEDIQDIFKCFIKLWTDKNGCRDLLMYIKTTAGKLFIESEGNTVDELLTNFSIIDASLK